MRKAEVMITLILCAVVVGCGGPAIIVTNQGRTLDGVPFYTKAVACKHETVWIEQTYKLTLIGTQPDKKKPDEKITCFSRSAEITQAGYVSKEFRDLKNLIDQRKSTDSIQKAFETLRKIFQYTTPAIGPDIDFSKRNLILVSNKNEPVPFVDYTSPYYINAKKPWAGSVNPDITLTSDLTLGKVNVNIQEETLKTILSALPAKEVLSAAVMGLKEVIEVTPSICPETSVTAVQLTVEPQVYKYTLSINEKATELPCKNPRDILHNVSGVTFSRTLESAEESKKKEDGGNTLKFSGSVDLPKAPPQPSPKNGK